jgi:tetratricopeptide (TPR) repeat protein
MPWAAWPKDDGKGLARYVLPEVSDKVRTASNTADLEARGELDAVAREIYEALAAQDIRWARARYNPDDAVQNVRPPGDILTGAGDGTCLDLALLFAGVALGKQLLPLVIVLEGHALAAVSRTTERGDATGSERQRAEIDWTREGLLTNSDKLKQMVDEGRYVLVECTGFAVSDIALSATRPEGRGRINGRLDWGEAVRAGREQLEEVSRPLLFAVDVAALQDYSHFKPFDPLGQGTAALREQALRECVANYPPKRAAAIDRNVLGVRYSERERKIGGKFPYIPRTSVDRRLGEALRDKSLILLVAVSAWGKSRSAYEAVKRIHPTASVVIPTVPKGVEKLAFLDPPFTTDSDPWVLWLDDVNVYLPKLGDAALSSLLERGEHGLSRVIILATMRTEQREVLLTAGPKNAASFNGRHLFARAAGDVGAIIEPSAWAEAQSEVARKWYPDADFSHGIGQWFVAKEELLQRYKASVTSRPLGRALVEHAIDWRRCGAAGGIPENLLRDHWLAGSMGVEVTRSSFDKNLRWAMKSAPGAGIGLLKRVKQLLVDRNGEWYTEPFVSALVPEDVLVAHDSGEGDDEPRPIPAAIWGIVREQTLWRERGRLGWAALQWGTEYEDVVELAAEDAQYPESAWMLGTLRELQAEGGELHERQARLEQALHLYSMWAEGTSYSEAQISMARVLESLGRSHEAVALLTPLSDHGDPAAAYELGRLLHTADTWEQAEPHLRRAVEANMFEAVADLGMLLVARRGKDDARAHEEGMQLLQIAAHAGITSAAFNLAQALWQEGDSTGSQEWLERAARAGDGYAAYVLAIRLRDRGDQADAQRWFIALVTDSRMRADAAELFSQLSESDPEPAIEFAQLLDEQGYSEEAAVWRRRAHEVEQRADRDGV